jgi:hypothetical protein
MLKLRTSRFMISTPIIKAATRGTSDMSIPKIKEANMSPKNIAQVETGEHTSLSRVFDLVSQGSIAGPTDVAVKKTVMPISPGKSSFAGTFRPIVYARKRNNGNIRPNVKTGPLE